jgi:hypothetical protein
MAVDQQNGRLFIGCANRRMVILDSNNGNVIGSVSNGQGPDDSAYDPGTGLVYISNGDGTVSIIRQESPDHYNVLETVKTASGARNMALDLRRRRYSCHCPTVSHRPRKIQILEAMSYRDPSEFLSLAGKNHAGDARASPLHHCRSPGEEVTVLFPPDAV